MHHIVSAGDTKLLGDAVPAVAAERELDQGERAEGGVLDHQQHHGGQPPADPGCDRRQRLPRPHQDPRHRGVQVDSLQTLEEINGSERSS